MRNKVFTSFFIVFFLLSIFGAAWAGDILKRPELSTFAEIFGLVDFLVLMYVLHKIYHAIFHVIYFGIGAMFKELLATWIIAAIIMQIPYNLYIKGSITGAYVVLVVILILPIIFAFKKKGDSN